MWNRQVFLQPRGTGRSRERDVGGCHTWIAPLLGLLPPFVVGLAASGLAWGLATFASPERLPLLGVVPNLAPVARFVLLTGILLVLGIAPAVVSATVEGIRWRGYLLLRLQDARAPHAVLVSGAIWALPAFTLLVTAATVVVLAVLLSPPLASAADTPANRVGEGEPA